MEEPAPPTAAAAETRAKTRNATVLCLSYILDAVQRHVISQTTVELWLKYFDNDFIAYARMISLVKSATSVGSLVSDPVVAGLSDLIGRKKIMIIRPVSSLLCRLLQLYGMLNPAVFLFTELVANTIEGSSTPGGLLGNTFRLGWEASVADMFSHDLVELGGWQSNMNMMPSISAMVTPIAAGILTTVGLSLPYYVGIVGCAVNIIVLSCFYKETLPASERIALSVRSSNPFSFGKLLTHGQRLRQFALMEVLNNFGSMRAIWQTTDTLRMEMLGWGPPERARMMSMTGFSSIPGGLGVRPAIQRFGVQRSIMLGLLLGIAANVGNGLSTKGWQFMLFLFPMRCGLAISEGAQQAAVMQCAVEAGLAKGQISGSLGNLKTLCQIISPIMWSEVYAIGSRMGRPSLLFAGVGAVNVLHLLATIMLPPARPVAATAAVPAAAAPSKSSDAAATGSSNT